MTTIRWMIKADMPRVLEIERASFANPWNMDTFLACLGTRWCVGNVVESHDGEVVGFMIYQLQKGRIELVAIAVCPECRRQGIGSQMIQRLIAKLTEQRRHELIVNVREANLDTHLFLRSQGLRATEVLRDYYDDPTEDCYTFAYRLRERVVG